MPANPGVNPSLTITALAEYIMSQLPAKAANSIGGACTCSIVSMSARLLAG